MCPLILQRIWSGFVAYFVLSFARAMAVVLTMLLYVQGLVEIPNSVPQESGRSAS